MTDGQENCASRRVLLKGAPAPAVIAAVAAETGIALASASDPYPRLCAAYHSTTVACDVDNSSDAVAEHWAGENRRICDALIATRATTPAGALAKQRRPLARLSSQRTEARRP